MSKSSKRFATPGWQKVELPASSTSLSQLIQLMCGISIHMSIPAALCIDCPNHAVWYRGGCGVPGDPALGVHVLWGPHEKQRSTCPHLALPNKNEAGLGLWVKVAWANDVDPEDPTDPLWTLRQNVVAMLKDVMQRGKSVAETFPMRRHPWSTTIKSDGTVIDQVARPHRSNILH